MRKPNFSIVLIAKNESNTLPRCLDSLKEFMDRGGEVILGDTGSTDDTVKIAEDRGVKVYKINAKSKLTKREKKAINALVSPGEGTLVDMDQEVEMFDFSVARNKATYHASNDFIISLDCDEVYTNFDIDYIINLVDSGVTQIEYTFIYSHNPDGTPSLLFKQSKAFDRRVLAWAGIIHEVLSPLFGLGVNTQNVSVVAPEDKILLEHWQEPGKESRSNYIIGLAYDVTVNPENDRHVHYLGREFMYRQMYQSAVAMFDRHIELPGWEPETAQSIIYRTDCQRWGGHIARPDMDYLTAFTYDPKRNLALLRIAQFYLEKQMYEQAIVFAKMASSMKISNHFYDEQPYNYNEEPFRIMYLCYGFLGRIQEASDAIRRCIEVAPYNETYYSHYHYYHDLPTITVLIPRIENTREEGMEALMKSIMEQVYPAEKIKMSILPNDETVPEKVNRGVRAAETDLIVFAADDMYFDKYDFIKAVATMDITGKSLVAFNTGPVNSEGYLCEHFIIKRYAIGQLQNGQLFDERLHHCGVDDFLWKQMDAIGMATRCEYTKTTHNHFSRGGNMDRVYEKGWSKVNSDRDILDSLIKSITT